MIPLISVTILYNPESEIIKNISSYSEHVEKLILIDNTESDNTPFINNLSQSPFFDKIIFIRSKSNEGIAKALNKAAAQAISMQYEWMLTMDQDSSFDEEQLKKYIGCLDKIADAKVGMVGPNYIDDTFTEAPNELCKSQKVGSIITSGAIVNLNTYKTIGPFNEDLFIDGVDDEYCFRLIMGGYDVLQFPNIHLKHNLGNLVSVRNWHIGKAVERNLHSPVRIYYMTRNYLYLIKKYKEVFPGKPAEYKKELFVKIKNSLLYDKHRLRAFKYFLKGWYHFKRGRFGKL